MLGALCCLLEASSQCLELLLYSSSSAVFVFLAPSAPAAPKARQQIKESRRSAPSALRSDGDFFELGPLYF